MPPVSGSRWGDPLATLQIKNCNFPDALNGWPCILPQGHLENRHKHVMPEVTRYTMVHLLVYPQYPTKDNKNQALTVMVIDAPDKWSAIRSAEEHVKVMLPKSERHRIPIALGIEKKTTINMFASGNGGLCRYGEKHDDNRL